MTKSLRMKITFSSKWLLWLVWSKKTTLPNNELSYMEKGYFAI